MSELRKKSTDFLMKTLREVEVTFDSKEEESDDRLLHRLIEKHLYLDKTPYRKQLLKEFKDGAPLKGKEGLRRKLAALDLSFFGRAYFPHYFSKESPEFHKELDDIWEHGVLKSRIPYNPNAAKEINKEDGCRRAVAAPRGHAKSTNLTFKDVCHSVLYQYKNYIMIISDSSEQAEGFLSSIRDEFEDNQRIAEDFGSLEGKVWKTNVLLTSTNIKIEAIGSGKKVRGRKHRNWRPDLIVLDDIENDENVNTPEQRKKLASWYFKAVSKAGDTYTDIVYIGTILHYDSLLCKVLSNSKYESVKYRAVIEFSGNQHLWDTWETIYTDLENDKRKEDAYLFFECNRTEMLEGTKVLWEEKLDYYKLMEEKLSDGDSAFNSEYQNEPIDPDNCTFNEEWFDFYEDETIDFSDSKFVFIGANDPSLGKNKRSDTSSIIVLAKDTSSGYMYIVDASVEKRKPDQIIDDAIENSRRLKRDYKKTFLKFGVETVQFQHFFKDVLAAKSREAGEYLPIEEVYSMQNKQLRIESLQPFIKNRYLKFNKKHKTLLKQFYEYPMGRNDDGPDGVEMAVRLATNINTSSATDYKTVIKRLVNFKKGAF